MARPLFQGCAFPVMNHLSMCTSSGIVPQLSLLWADQDNSPGSFACAVCTPQPSSSLSTGSWRYVNGSLVLGSRAGSRVTGAELIQGQYLKYLVRVRSTKHKCFYIKLSFIEHGGSQHLPDSVQKSVWKWKHTQWGSVLTLHLGSLPGLPCHCGMALPRWVGMP